MIELFSDIFSLRENALSRRDPRVKLIVALAAIGFAIAPGSVYYCVFLLISCAAGAVVLRLPWRSVAFRIALPFGAVGVLCVLQTFMTPGESIFGFKALGHDITATREGLSHAVEMGSRVAGAASAVVLLGMTTKAHEVFSAMLWMGAPSAWVEVAMLMYRYVFVLLDSAADMATAQVLRLGYTRGGRAMRSAGMLSGAVLVRSFDQAGKTNEAMMLRGYNGKLPAGRLPKLRNSDAGLAALACFVLCAAYFISKRFGG